MNKVNEKPTLIVIAGPTAVGKSELAAELGRRIDGEVVSADSMQVYRHMDIGSAKVTLEEMLGVPHHMIDVTDPSDPMDVVRYASMASACIEDIVSRGRVPILCGGTGFYIQAVTHGIDFTETGEDTAFREEMREVAKREGPEALHARLALIDPESALAIHPNNVKRVIRALEFYRETGRPISAHNEEQKKRTSPYDLVAFAITDDRAKMYERIDRRVDFMMEAGLADEVAYLRAMGLDRTCVSMQGIGYKELLDAMDGLMSYEEAVRAVKLGSRHYAKRQLTWLRRDPDMIFIDRRDFGGDTWKVLDEIIRIIEEKTKIRAHDVKDPYT
ncbi:MAG: tRNA (adenosine(37)-N6)-dimethylallyltransferase MiaA [Lachnospiraceae bacterium]|nr:tRNA (adenosine(37)-N6)-dimethylallyltransferase MiaA [Lachnospiraceae bacterium]